jgi:dolichol kinase
VLRSFLYFALVLALGEIARRRLSVPAAITRKGVLAALAIWAVVAVFQRQDIRGTSAAFLLLAGVLYFSFRFEILAALEDEGPTLGTVLAPLSLALLLALLGIRSPHIAAAAAVSMFGDFTAALVGRRRGTRKYRLFGHARTMEGTLAFFLVAGAAMVPALGLLGGLDWHQAVAFALIAATVGATVETISIHGSDNATVPLATAATLVFLTGVTG